MSWELVRVIMSIPNYMRVNQEVGLSSMLTANLPSSSPYAPRYLVLNSNMADSISFRRTSNKVIIRLAKRKRLTERPW